MKKFNLPLALLIGITLPAAAALKFVKADSEESAGEDGAGANAFDSNAETIWHTQWQDDSPAHPHYIVFQLDPPAKIKGLTYLPRQSEDNSNVNGTIKGYEIYVSEDGKAFNDLVKTGKFTGGQNKKTVVFPLIQAGFVKLVALDEVGGNPWTSAAEIGVVGENETVNVPPSAKVVSFDSEETSGEDGTASNAVDGDPATIWHTQWESDSPACPHEIVLKLETPTKITGLTYVPRQDEQENGMIKDYEIFTSEDGKVWGDAAVKGTFEKSGDTKTATFAPRTAGWIKLRALSEVNDGPWTSAAEITVVPAK